MLELDGHDTHDQPTSSAALPYWLVNVPADQQPPTCPDFLRDLCEKDRRTLATPDADYHRISWSRVQDIIRSNRIDLFQRVPSDFRRYRAFTARLARDYGSVMNFIMRERLQWSHLVPAETAPFTDQGRVIRRPSFQRHDELISRVDDIKILYNDWPYGIDERIVHLVVWTRFQMEEDPKKGDLTETGRRRIDEYVGRTFRSKVRPEHVAWFRNWTSIKSIHAVEHFHVMLFDPDVCFIQEITNGDVPLVHKFAMTNEG